MTSPIIHEFAKPNTLYSFLYNTFLLPFFFFVLLSRLIKSVNFSHNKHKFAKYVLSLGTSYVIIGLGYNKL